MKNVDEGGVEEEGEDLGDADDSATEGFGDGGAIGDAGAEIAGELWHDDNTDVDGGGGGGVGGGRRYVRRIKSCDFM